MADTKEFYNIFCNQQNLERIATFASAGLDESTKASKTSSLYVLNNIMTHHLDKMAKKDQAKDEKKENPDEEEDLVQQTSDDEKDDEQDPSNPNSLVSQDARIAAVLLTKVENLKTILVQTAAQAE